MMKAQNQKVGALDRTEANSTGSRRWIILWRKRTALLAGVVYGFTRYPAFAGYQTLEPEQLTRVVVDGADVMLVRPELDIGHCPHGQGIGICFQT